MIKSRTIEELEDNLRKVYTSGSGVEFSHITVLEEKEWLYDNYEAIMLGDVPTEKKI